MKELNDKPNSNKRSRYNLRSNKTCVEDNVEPSEKRTTVVENMEIKPSGTSDIKVPRILIMNEEEDTDTETETGQETEEDDDYTTDEDESMSLGECDTDSEEEEEELSDDDDFINDEDIEEMSHEEIRKKLMKLSKSGEKLLASVAPKIIGNYAISLADLTTSNSKYLDETLVSELKDVATYILHELPTPEKILQSNLKTEDKADIIEMFMVLEHMDPSDHGTREMKNLILNKLRSLSVDKETRKEEDRIRTVKQNVSLCSLRRKDVFPEIRKRILESHFTEANKLYLLHQMDALHQQRDEEFGKFIKWFQFVLSIPTGESKRHITICPTSSIEEKAQFMFDIRKELDYHVFGMKKVKEYVECEIFHYLSNPNATGKCMGLCGPPGVGKTWIMNVIAKVIKRPIIKIPLGGKHDVSVLSGHSLTYVSSCPGQIAKGFVETQCVNPIILFDEVDKIESRHGDSIANNLIHVVDPVQNSEYHDDYVSFPFDISQALSVFIMNKKETVNPILLNRMNIIELKGYDMKQKVHMGRDFLLPRVLKEYNFKEDDILCDDAVLEKIVLNTKEEPGARFLTISLNTIVKRLNVMKNLWDPKKKDYPDSIKSKLPDYFINDFSLPLKLTVSHIDTLLPVKHEDTSRNRMYL